MARKPRTTVKAVEVVIGDDPATEVIEVAHEEVVPEPEVIVKPIVVEDDKPIPEIPTDLDALVGVNVSIIDYATNAVSLEEAIKLLQKVLNISKTGVVDNTTKQAYLGANDKNSIIDDYNNLRKDTELRDLSVIRNNSKQLLRGVIT